MLSQFQYIDRRTCPSMYWVGRFSPSELTRHVWGSEFPFNTWFLGPTQVNVRNVRQTTLLSLCSNRPHLASSAIRPKVSYHTEIQTRELVHEVRDLSIN